MTQPEPGAVVRRPHHISSIAHLFLQDADPDKGRPPVTVREFAVATPGKAPVSAFAAAGLTMAHDGPAELAEDSRLLWSASSYLGAPEENPRLRNVHHQTGRTVWEMAADPDGLPAPVEVRWRHLGCLEAADLVHLESWVAIRGFLPHPGIAQGGLVWCLLSSQISQLDTSYFLGRLVDILCPGRLTILVFPEAWSRALRPGVGDSPIPDEAPADVDLDRCADLARRACGDLPIRIHLVAGDDNRPGSFVAGGRAGSWWNRVESELTGEGPR